MVIASSKFLFETKFFTILGASLHFFLNAKHLIDLHYTTRILSIATANMMAVIFAPLLVCFAVGFILGFPLIMGSRLLLNLREMAERDPTGSIPSMTLPSMLFVPGQSVGTQQMQQNFSLSSEVR